MLEQIGKYLLNHPVADRWITILDYLLVLSGVFSFGVISGGNAQPVVELLYLWTAVLAVVYLLTTVVIAVQSYRYARQQRAEQLFAERFNNQRERWNQRLAELLPYIPLEPLDRRRQG